MRRPCLFLALAFAAGDAVGVLALSFATVRDAVLALLAAGLCLLSARLARARLGSVLPGVLACALLTGAAAGAGSFLLETRTLARYRAPDAPVRVDIELVQDPLRVRYGQELGARILGCEAHPALQGAGVRLTLSGEEGMPPLACGQRWRVWTRLEEPGDYRNPGAGNLRRLRHRRGTDFHGSCKSPLLLIPRPDAARCTPVHRLRRWLRAGLHAGVADPELRALLEALLLGERRGVPHGMRRALEEAGAAHLLAVSGLHVALLALGVGRLLRRSGLDPRAAIVAVACALVLYAGVAGGGAPVVRAVCFGLVFLFGRLLGRGTGAANALGIAALFQLSVAPLSVQDLSFRMSFLAAAAILRLAPPLSLWLESRAPRVPRPLRLVAAGSVAAQAGLLPEVCSAFGTVSPAAVLVNLVAIPAAGVFIAASLTLAVAGHLWNAAALAGARAVELLLGLLLATCRAGAVTSWSVPPPGWIAGAAWLLVLFLLPGLRGRIQGCALGALGVLLVLLVHPVGRAATVPDGRLRITALDVGQGDAVLLEAGRTAVLVDTGGSRHPGFDTGERLVAPALRHLGRRRIDVLVLSHPDVDHLGGAAWLVRHREVGAVWRPAAGADERRWSAVMEAAGATGTPVRHLSRGQVLKSGPLWFRVLWPEESTDSSTNDRSLVLAAGLEPQRPLVLLTGDIEAEAERRLLAGLPRVAVLKVPHHGSRTSSTPAFLEAVRPRVCLVSAGRHNPWGHPHADVLGRLRDRHCLLVRTDREGACSVEVDRGGRCRIEAAGGRAW